MPRESHHRDIVSLVETAPPKIDSDTLLKTACRALEVMEPWHSATSSSPVVIDIIEKVRDQGDAFYWAIEISIEAAQHGHRFCKDFSTIVEHLNDRRVTTKELREIISDMYAVAKKARRNAQDVVQLFRNMRQGLYTISNEVPAEIAKLELAQQRDIKKIADSQKHIHRIKATKAFSVAASAVVGAVAIVTFPPAMLVLPIIFPLVTLVTEGIELRIEKKVEKREERVGDCRDAIQQLHSVTKDMLQLEESISFFAEYWIRQETLLDVVKNRIDDLRESRYLGLKLGVINESWREVSDSLLDYAIKLKTLQTYAPIRVVSSIDTLDSSTSFPKDFKSPVLDSTPSSCTVSSSVKLVPSELKLHSTQKQISQRDGTTTATSSSRRKDVGQSPSSKSLERKPRTVRGHSIHAPSSGSTCGRNPTDPNRNTTSGRFD